MKLKTLIVDDEPIALAKLAGYVAKAPVLELVGKCSSSIEALEIVRTKEVDLIFTDINMPDLNGLEMVDTLSSDAMIVFITAYSDYAVESYRLEAVDYLLKPYGFSDFMRAARRAYDRHKMKHGAGHEENDEFNHENEALSECNTSMQSSSHPNTKDEALFIKVDYKYIRVDPVDILFIKGFGEYLQIFLRKEEKPLLTLSSFAAILEKLPSYFLQIHRSYIANMKLACQIERSRIAMEGSEVLPIGDSFKANLQRYLGNHSVGGSGRQ